MPHRSFSSARRSGPPDITNKYLARCETWTDWILISRETSRLSQFLSRAVWLSCCRLPQKVSKAAQPMKASGGGVFFGLRWRGC